MGSMSTFRSYQAQAAVEGNRIVDHGTVDGTAIKATGPTDKLLGAADALDKAVGEFVDLNTSPLGDVRLGGTVARGDALTSDANGKAVVTTTAGHRIIGFADASGVVDDVIPFLRANGVY